MAHKDVVGDEEVPSPDQMRRRARRANRRGQRTEELSEENLNEQVKELINLIAGVDDLSRQIDVQNGVLQQLQARFDLLSSSIGNETGEHPRQKSDGILKRFTQRFGNGVRRVFDIARAAARGAVNAGWHQGTWTGNLRERWGYTDGPIAVGFASVGAGIVIATGVATGAGLLFTPVAWLAGPVVAAVWGVRTAISYRSSERVREASESHRIYLPESKSRMRRDNALLRWKRAPIRRKDRSLRAELEAINLAIEEDKRLIEGLEATRNGLVAGRSLDSEEKRAVQRLGRQGVVDSLEAAPTEVGPLDTELLQQMKTARRGLELGSER